MTITKFDLYNPEWLELVFDKRNQDYGAYDLRKHYGGNLLKAMAITFFSMAFLYTGYNILFKAKPVATYREIPVVIIQPLVETHPRIVVPPKPATSAPHQPVTTVRYSTPVVTRDRDAENPPKLTDLETAPISSQTTKGKNGDDANVSINDLGTGTTVPPSVIEDTAPRDWTSVEVLPTPYGGAAAWARFLQKNIHYPARATEEGKQGKVMLSFIVEKDGTLTNITVDRPMGFGLDEEAVRVLKLAPAWKPGIQNGHPVRVKFVIPITFQLSDPE